MSRTQKVIPSLIGGISQQPPEIRFPSQVEDLANGWPSPVRGLEKRPPTDHLARILDTVPEEAFFHLIERDSSERYLVVVLPDAVRVFDLDGTEYDVVNANLGSGEPNLSYIDRWPNNPLSAGEQPGLDAASWFLAGGATATVSAEPAPIGDGFAVDAGTGGGAGTLTATRTAGRLGARSHLSVWAKRDDGLTSVSLRIEPNDVDREATFVWSGSVLTVSGAPTYGTAAVIDRGGGWYEAVYTFDVGDDAADLFPLFEEQSAIVNFEIALVGGAGDTDFLWGARVTTDMTGSLAAADLPAPVEQFGPFRFLTIADSTFILNRSERPTAALGDAADVYTGEALAFIRQGLPAGATPLNWDISITRTGGAGGTTTFTVAVGSNTSLAATNFAAAIDGHADFVAVAQGSVIRITPAAGVVITAVEGEDTSGDTGLVIAFEETAKFARLPLVAPHGFVVRVNGEDGEARTDDSYYVRFVANAGSGFGEGVWEETGTGGVLNEWSMPHRLERLVDDAAGTITGTPFGRYFAFGRVEAPRGWAERVAGDDETNPVPGFADQTGFARTIQDLFFYEGRLGFLYDQNAALSEAGLFFNFWRTTLTTLPDSDPVDVASNETDVALLRNHAIVSGALVAFSDRSAFELNLDQDGAVTPVTAALRRAARGRFDPDVRPATFGGSVASTYSPDQFARVYQLVPGEARGQLELQDLSAAVPHLAPGPAGQLESAPGLDLLVLRGADPSTLYLLRLTVAGGEIRQQAWFRWTFGGDVRFHGFVEDSLYLILERDDGLYLERLRVGEGLTDSGSGRLVHLDRRVTEADLAPAYDALNDWTVLSVPYDLDTSEEYAVATRAFGGDEAGAELLVLDTDTSTPGAHTVTVQGDQSAAALFLGERYTFSVEFTEPVIQAEFQGGVSRVPGSFTVHFFTLSVRETGHVDVTVDGLGLDPFVTPWTAVELSTGDEVSAPALGAGDIVVGCLAPATGLSVTISSRSPLPARLVRARFEGDLSPHEVA